MAAMLVAAMLLRVLWRCLLFLRRTLVSGVGASFDCCGDKRYGLGADSRLAAVQVAENGDCPRDTSGIVPLFPWRLRLLNSEGGTCWNTRVGLPKFVDLSC